MTATEIFYDRLGEKHIKPNDIQANHRSSAYGAAIRDGQILLVKPPTGSFLELPGGKIEKHETNEEALKREFLEETGYKIAKIIELIIEKEMNFYSIHRKTYHYSKNYFYLVEQANDLAIKPKNDGDTLEAVWRELKNLNLKEICPNHQSIIEKLKEHYGENKNS